MRKTISIVLAILMVISILPMNFINANDAEKVKVTFTFTDSYFYEAVQEKMKVAFINAKTQEEKVFENANVASPGTITLDLEVGGIYRIELRETKYVITNNSGLFTVSKNQDGKAEARFNSNSFDATKLTIDKWIDTKPLSVKDNFGKKIEGELTFELRDSFMPNLKGKEYTTVNGKLPAMRILVDAEYVLKLKENDKYECDDIKISGFTDGEEPMDAHGISMDKITVNKKGNNTDTPSEPSVPEPSPAPVDSHDIDVYVWDNEGSPNTDGIKFNLISDKETKEYIVNYSTLSLSLKENIEYTLKIVDNEKYSMNNLKCYLKYDNGFRQYFLFGEDNRPITKIIVNKTKSQKPKRKGSKIINVKCDGEDVEEELDFTIENNGVVSPLMTDNSGTLIFRNLHQGEKYIIKLVNNDEYEMEPLEFTFDVQDGFDKETGILDIIKADGSLLEYIELNKKGSSQAKTHEFDFQFLVGSEKGNKIEKDIRTRLRSSNEASQNIDTKDGVAKFSFKEDKRYLLSIMDNEDYELSSLFVYYNDLNGNKKEERLLKTAIKKLKLIITKVLIINLLLF